MEITLHFGAHRCATTSFQEYMRRNAPALAKQGVLFWGPDKIRGTDLRGLKSMTPESHAALKQELDQCEAQGVTHLLVSEENFLGMMQQNFNTAELYPEAGLRARLVAEAFGGRVTGIALNIRALSDYWTSVAGYAARNRKHFKTNMRWKKITQHDRSWQGVISDLARAIPETPVLVLPFEEFSGRWDAQLARLLGIEAPRLGSDLWLNKGVAGDVPGPGSVQELSLLTKYADDLSWLEAGADGLATLCLLPETTQGEATPA